MINSDEEYMYSYIFVVTKNIIGWEPYFDILTVLIIEYTHFFMQSTYQLKENYSFIWQSQSHIQE